MIWGGYESQNVRIVEKIYTINQRETQKRGGGMKAIIAAQAVE
jgi:hypothetical protein